VPGLLVLAMVVARAPSRLSAAAAAGAWAAAGHLVALQFVVVAVARFADLGVAGGLAAWVLLAAAQALPWAAAGALAHALRRRLPGPVAMATAFTLVLWAPAVFPWTPAGLLAARPELIQGAALGGERLVTFAVLVLTALAAVGRPRAVAAAVAGAAALTLGGAWRMANLEAEGPEIAVALVSHAAPASRLPDPAATARLRALSAAADRAGARLVVWPEAAFPVPVERTATRLGGSASPVAGGAVAPRLLGLRTVDGARAWNSAIVVAPDGRLGRPYDKVRLLAFGETAPPLLGGVLPAASRATPGTAARPLQVTLRGGSTVAVGVLICFEDLRGDVAREAVARGGRLLVGLSNDAWFAGTSAPGLQARLARVRAVELRTDVVRAVNDGPSTWVDAAGRLRAVRTGAAAGGVLVRPALRAPDRRTPFGRFGDAPLLVALVGAVALGLWPRGRGVSGLPVRRVLRGRRAARRSGSPRSRARSPRFPGGRP
jgi:apolipoprotein N-acyltransferase